MKYSVINGVHVVEVPVKEFSIKIVDKTKKSAWTKNYCNGGFFAGFNESKPKEYFTLPVCNLKADYAVDPKKTWERHYTEERGSFDGNKWTFDSYGFTYMNPFAGHTTTNLVVYQGKAKIVTMNTVYDQPGDYIIGGVPLMVGGNDVKYDPYVKSQGWDSSTLYATKHIMVGVNSAKPDTIYVMGWKSTTGNMISSGEAYKKLKGLNLGLTDVIKLDGGGSYHLNVDGKAVDTMSENRQIQNILVWDDTQNGDVWYTAPTTSTTNTSTNTARTTANVNMRTGPGTAYGVITVVPKNAMVNVDASYNNRSWKKVIYNNMTGYCSSTYIAMVNTSSSTPTETSNNSNNNATLSSKNPYTVPSRTLKFGCKGSGVFWLQTELVHRGYDIGKSGVDGDFGSATRSAVKKWQADNNLVVDGYFGPASLNCMLNS